MKVPIIGDWAKFYAYNKADVDLSINLMVQAEALKHARKVERLIESARRAGQSYVAVADPVTGGTIVYHVKEPMKLTAQTRTLDQYRATFFTKALRQLASKVGFDLTTAPAHIQRIFEDARKVRSAEYWAYTYGVRPSEAALFKLEFRTLAAGLNAQVLVATVDAVHLFHVLDTLDTRGLTQKQELDVIVEHAERIVNDMLRHGLRKTTEAIVAAELK
ncbi:hypothetical protein [Ralstonia phage phiITL-1]|uniref:Uncharacterized protein n=1 Tax=Ralstonia phage phiITL-1 TaxID=1597967 RepID=A0A0U1ZEF7_9CAUD|nr:hypothetical protein HOR02_gp25 [Ralstonia phage phiITL-1]AJT60809.1 hypothetical protein [Ralstonia phage phiITL-1]